MVAGAEVDRFTLSYFLVTEFASVHYGTCLPSGTETVRLYYLSFQ